MKFKDWMHCFFLLAFLGIIACTKDNTTTPTPTTVDCSTITASYANDIKPIVNNSCAISGCHVAGFSSGDFTNYTGLKAKVEDGTIKNRAIVQMNMPPASSSGPTSLTSTQLNLLTCWIEAGAPEN